MRSTEINNITLSKTQVSSKKLKKTIESQKKMRKEFGPIMAKIICRRMEDLQACENLEAARDIPGRFHSVNKIFPGCYALHLEEPDRLVLCPVSDQNQDSIQEKESLSSITKIEIVYIGDYHKR